MNFIKGLVRKSSVEQGFVRRQKNDGQKLFYKPSSKPNTSLTLMFLSMPWLFGTAACEPPKNNDIVTQKIAELLQEGVEVKPSDVQKFIKSNPKQFLFDAIDAEPDLKVLGCGEGHFSINHLKFLSDPTVVEGLKKRGFKAFCIEKAPSWLIGKGKKKDLQTFLDEWNAKPGQPIPEAIKKAIELEVKSTSKNLKEQMGQKFDEIKYSRRASNYIKTLEAMNRAGIKIFAVDRRLELRKKYRDLDFKLRFIEIEKKCLEEMFKQEYGKAFKKQDHAKMEALTAQKQQILKQITEKQTYAANAIKQFREGKGETRDSLMASTVESICNKYGKAICLWGALHNNRNQIEQDYSDTFSTGAIPIKMKLRAYGIASSFSRRMTPHQGTFSYTEPLPALCRLKEKSKKVLSVDFLRDRDSVSRHFYGDVLTKLEMEKGKSFAFNYRNPVIAKFINQEIGQSNTITVNKANYKSLSAINENGSPFYDIAIYVND